MKVQHNSEGYSAYCFSCKKFKIQKHGVRSISQLALVRNTSAFCKENACTTNLPKDFTKLIPPEHAVWLYKAGIYKDTYEKYGIGWSPGMQRVVLPVYQDGKLVYQQCRSVIKGMQPKYLNTRDAGRDTIMFKSLPSKYILNKKVVVVTEDILSAIRTGVFLKSFSTMGTKITDAMAYILSEYLCIIWYDNDKGGWDNAPIVKKKLESIGVPCLNYIGTQDPKGYTNQELQEILQCQINKLIS